MLYQVVQQKLNSKKATWSLKEAVSAAAVAKLDKQERFRLNQQQQKPWRNPIMIDKNTAKTSVCGYPRKQQVRIPESV